ncbi:MAG: single-stranded DNA-binding protein [Erysipelotrichia bacterium]|nr:single-stranded DNA-binding protein [Erysipelotrichia bacterium]
MVSLNRVLLAGNLVKDPELKETSNGRCLTVFPVAVDKHWRSNDGQSHKETAFFRIIVWNAIAENCVRYLKKGKSVLIEGRLETRTYKNSEGQTQYITQIVGDQVTFLSKPDKTTAAEDEPAIM